MENKIELLINELIEELKKDGKSIASPDINKGFGSFTVFVHNLGTEEKVISIQKLSGGQEWEIKVKPTFKEF